MSRKLFCCVLTAMLLLFAAPSALAATQATEHVSVRGYDSETDYLVEMQKCAQDGGEYAMQIGELYEKQRNLKIETLELEQRQTTYFLRYETGEEVLSAMRADRLKAEHEAAGQVYEYLNARGYSDAVIAGILGNMMAECGGQTLALQWDIYGGGGNYYGLCQWSLRYGPEVGGRSVLGQLDYLTGNLGHNIEQFGGSYEYFRSIQDAGEAARYFARYYERGGGSGARARNAYRALAWIQG